MASTSKPTTFDRLDAGKHQAVGCKREDELKQEQRSPRHFPRLPSFDLFLKQHYSPVVTKGRKRVTRPSAPLSSSSSSGPASSRPPALVSAGRQRTTNRDAPMSASKTSQGSSNGGGRTIPSGPPTSSSSSSSSSTTTTTTTTTTTMTTTSPISSNKTASALRPPAFPSFASFTSFSSSSSSTTSTTGDNSTAPFSPLATARSSHSHHPKVSAMTLPATLSIGTVVAASASTARLAEIDTAATSAADAIPEAAVSDTKSPDVPRVSPPSNSSASVSDLFTAASPETSAQVHLADATAGVNLVAIGFASSESHGGRNDKTDISVVVQKGTVSAVAMVAAQADGQEEKTEANNAEDEDKGEHDDLGVFSFGDGSASSSASSSTSSDSEQSANEGENAPSLVDNAALDALVAEANAMEEKQHAQVEQPRHGSVSQPPPPQREQEQEPQQQQQQQQQQPERPKRRSPPPPPPPQTQPLAPHAGPPSDAVRPPSEAQRLKSWVRHFLQLNAMDQHVYFEELLSQSNERTQELLLTACQKVSAFYSLGEEADNPEGDKAWSGGGGSPRSSLGGSQHGSPRPRYSETRHFNDEEELQAERDMMEHARLGYQVPLQEVEDEDAFAALDNMYEQDDDEEGEEENSDEDEDELNEYDLDELGAMSSDEDRDLDEEVSAVSSVSEQEEGESDLSSSSSGSSSMSSTSSEDEGYRGYEAYRRGSTRRKSGLERSKRQKKRRAATRARRKRASQVRQRGDSSDYGGDPGGVQECESDLEDFTASRAPNADEQQYTEGFGGILGNAPQHGRQNSSPTASSASALSSSSRDRRSRHRSNGAGVPGVDAHTSDPSANVQLGLRVRDANGHYSGGGLLPSLLTYSRCHELIDFLLRPLPPSLGTLMMFLWYDRRAGRIHLYLDGKSPALLMEARCTSRKQGELEFSVCMPAWHGANTVFELHQVQASAVSHFNIFDGQTGGRTFRGGARKDSQDHSSATPAGSGGGGGGTGLRLAQKSYVPSGGAGGGLYSRIAQSAAAANSRNYHQGGGSGSTGVVAGAGMVGNTRRGGPVQLGAVQIKSISTKPREVMLLTPKLVSAPPQSNLVPSRTGAATASGTPPASPQLTARVGSMPPPLTRPPRGGSFGSGRPPLKAYHGVNGTDAAAGSSHGPPPTSSQLASGGGPLVATAGQYSGPPTQTKAWDSPREEDQMLQSALRGERDDLTILHSREATFDKATGAYTMDFGERVKTASSKNVILVEHMGDPEQNKLMTGKVHGLQYAVDAAYPLSPVLAFAVCIANIVTKTVSAD